VCAFQTVCSVNDTSVNDLCWVKILSQTAAAAWQERLDHPMTAPLVRWFPSSVGGVDEVSLDDDEASPAEGPPLLLALPLDLLYLTVAELPAPRDVASLRSCCKVLRQATSHVELWAGLAQRRWFDSQRSISSRLGHQPRRVVTTPKTSALVLPIALGRVASLVDVCARIVPMPAGMQPWTNGASPATSTTISANGTVRFARGGVALQYAVADCCLPPMRGAREVPPSVAAMFPGSAARVQAPLPFATDACGLGAPGQWALRMFAYFEATVHEQSDHAEGIAIGLGVSAVFPRASGLLGRGPGSVSLLTGSGLLCYCALADGASGIRIKLGVRAGPGDVVGCGLDYRRGVAFFTLNGALLEHAALPLPLHHGWVPLVGSRGGGAATVHLREGGGSSGGGSYLYDLLQREEECWDSWSSDYAMRQLFEEQHDPSTLGNPRERGWPWYSGGSAWEKEVLDHCTPWLAQKRSKSRGRVAMPGATPFAMAADAVDGEEVGEPGGTPSVGWTDLPALMVLAEGATPQLDALAVTADDVQELASFLAEVALPAWVAQRLGSQGIRLALLQSLPIVHVARWATHTIYIYIYICVCKYMYMYMYIFIYAYTYIYVYLCVSVCFSIYVSISISISVFLSINVCIYIYIYIIYIYVYIHTYIYR